MPRDWQAVAIRPSNKRPTTRTARAELNGKHRPTLTLTLALVLTLALSRIFPLPRLPFSYITVSLTLALTPPPPSPSPRNPPSHHTGKKRKKFLPDDAKAILTKWCRDNIDHPYPTEHEKLDLCAATHLTLIQVNYWCVTAILEPARK